MPKFSQETIEVKKPGRKAAGIPQEIIEEYKGYIESLEKGNRGSLSFGKNENINQRKQQHRVI